VQWRGTESRGGEGKLPRVVGRSQPGGQKNGPHVAEFMYHTGELINQAQGHKVLGYGSLSLVIPARITRLAAARSPPRLYSPSDYLPEGNHWQKFVVVLNKYLQILQDLVQWPVVTRCRAVLMMANISTGNLKTLGGVA